MFFPFLIFSIKKLLTVQNYFCFLAGTDIAQFLFGFMSSFSETSSLKNLNAILICQKPLKKKGNTEQVINFFNSSCFLFWAEKTHPRLISNH